MSNGWDESAEAWIASLGEDGDYGRKYVLDAPMLARIQDGSYGDALDIGCGEGRFSRILRGLGINVVGVDLTDALIHRARQRDPTGDYRIGNVENLEFPDNTFDLVVSYLTFIDFPDIKRAIEEIVRVLRPGGVLLVANLTSFNTAGPPEGWVRDVEGQPRFFIDQYLEERARWVSWSGVRVQNWHRPLSTYMSLLLGHRLELRHFSEPLATGGEPKKAEHYARVPWFFIMEWRKPM